MLTKLFTFIVIFDEQEFVGTYEELIPTILWKFHLLIE